MRISRQVLCSIDDAEAQKFDSALLHACIAIDSTSKRLFPNEGDVGRRYVHCLRQYYWIVEPMIGGGLNLDETIFSNINIRKKPSPDIADVIYTIFRCAHAHGDEIPDEFMLIPSIGDASQWIIGKNRLNMPDRVIWALLAVVVFSKVNANQKSQGDYFLSLGEDRFLLRDWWGREDDFRFFASRYNQVRVRFDKLDTFVEASAPPTESELAHVHIVQPHAVRRHEKWMESILTRFKPKK